MERLRGVFTRAKNTGQGAVKPVTRIYEKEVESAREANCHLPASALAFVALSAIAVVILTVMVRAMYVSKYATLSVEELKSYHPIVPWLTLASSGLYISAIYLKGVRYWLTYFPASMAIFGSLVFLGLYHEVITPEQLSFMDFGPAWWRGE